MLRRIFILTFIATLTFLLSGERHIDIQTSPSSQHQSETIIVDADIPNLTSLLSGQTSLRSSSKSRRSIQRTNSKRLENTQVIAQSNTKGASIEEHSNYTIKSNLLGGVVAERAFYSLCCLRI